MRAAGPGRGVRSGVRLSLQRLHDLVRPRPWRARGAVVVLTGAAGGIGTALAHELAARGALLVLVDRDTDGLERLRSALPPAGVRAGAGASPGAGSGSAGGTGHLVQACDVLAERDIEALAARLDHELGRVDVLVNNTGVTVAARFAGRTVASMTDEVMLNTISPLAVTHRLLPLLRHSADPRVITTVSLAGIWPQPETPLYCASKFGLRGAMLSIALDLADEGIRVSSVLPSATDTRMLRQEAVDGGSVLQFQHPPQQPADVVRAVLSLLHRPRLEAYPRPAEALQVRIATAFPNLVPVLIPLFEASGRRGMDRYLDTLRASGAVVEVDGRLELVDD